MKKISVVLKTFEKYNFILSSSKIVNILLSFDFNIFGIK